MTTDDTGSNKSNDPQDADKHQANSNNISASVPPEIMDILKHLSSNPNIFFKSQQRDEPELLQTDKIKVAKDIYQRNPQTFLMRFGGYMEEKHLNDFARLSIAKSDDEMYSMINEYQRRIKTRSQDIKNRRYAALQKLIEEGEYFSEQEMMKRCPELYQELVGQHLSKEEKKMRDSYDVKNTTFSGILMHNMEQKELSEIMEKVEKKMENECDDSNETSSSSSLKNATVEEIRFRDTSRKGSHDEGDAESEIPSNFRQQWGNFDNEPQACSSSKCERELLPTKAKISNSCTKQLITADERELLRQEFVSQMHEHFLSGQDSDFDYSTVDDNTQFDDLKILNQDREDKYFEKSDEDEDGDDEIISDFHKMEQSESEDELDLYMSHLNKHHSLQK